MNPDSKAILNQILISQIISTTTTTAKNDDLGIWIQLYVLIVEMPNRSKWI